MCLKAFEPLRGFIVRRQRFFPNCRPSSRYRGCLALGVAIRGDDNAARRALEAAIEDRVAMLGRRRRPASKTTPEAIFEADRGVRVDVVLVLANSEVAAPEGTTVLTSVHRRRRSAPCVGRGRGLRCQL